MLTYSNPLNIPTIRNPLYKAYKNSVSPLIPMPSKVYRSFPKLLKAVLFCEFPMYSRQTYEGMSNP
jgi:hypothetical protein